jgi:hypothetical protein
MTIQQEISTTEMNDAFDDKHFEYLKGAYMGVGPGWFTLLHNLCLSIDGHLKWKNRDAEHKLVVEVSQIKEKFGGLRFYTGPIDDTIDGMISFAEVMSIHTCEQCGSPGKRRNDIGWIQTLCDEHYNQVKKDKNESRD